MACLFTEHIRRFGPDSDPQGRVLSQLEHVLKRRMRRRGLLSGPPAYLGYNVPAWSVPGAMDDLVMDCYIFAVLDRLVALRRQLRTRDEIGGLIVRNVDHFLLERQRRHDPVGYAVFGNVEAAVERAAAAAELLVEGRKNGRVRNQSLVRFLARTPASQSAGPQRLRQVLAKTPGWSSALGDLVMTTQAGQAWVARYLSQLRAEGIGVVRFGDVVRVIAAAARADWASRHADRDVVTDGEGEIRELIRMIAPDHAVDDRDHWEWFKREVGERIMRIDRQARVRRRLADVFKDLCRLAEEPADNPIRQAEVVRRLGLRRTTVSDDFPLLRQILECLRKEADGSGGSVGASR